VGVALLARQRADCRRPAAVLDGESARSPDGTQTLYPRVGLDVGEEQSKGAIAIGQLADFVALSADYFAMPEHEIKEIESVLTVVDGKVVFGSGPFASLGPAPLPVTPDCLPWDSMAARIVERSPRP